MIPVDDIPSAFEATRWHRARVEAFAAWLGLRVRWDQLLLPGGVAYRGGQIAALCDVLQPWMALHDVAHWLLAPAWRRRRLLEGIHTEKHWPWCARELPDGLRCRALTTVLVQLPAGGAVERCADCARWHEREGTGKALRALAPR